ncbi:TIGR02452 family protein [bacterium]|nr:TIGR02452 family protein [bacterium]
MSLKQSAQDVLHLIERGFYEVEGQRISIESARDDSLDSSRIYTPRELEDLRTQLPQGRQPKITVVNGTTQVVAQALASHDGLLVLNFASARNPGGGFLNGAKAQEEDLCRCSALYPSLVRHREYYEMNRQQTSLLYTDFLIYSPRVPFFKIRGTGQLLPTPFEASVVTAPAPNSGPYLKNSGDPTLLEQCFERRWRNVLAVAKDQQIPNLLLGAWGCGAFGGDPKIASRTAQRALADFGPAFSSVTFAIPGKGKQSRHNLEAFGEQFEVKIENSI